MDCIEQYENERGYRLPDGWTREEVIAHRPAVEMVPLASNGVVVAWGVPEMLHQTGHEQYESRDGRFIATLTGRIEDGDYVARAWEVFDRTEPDRVPGRCMTLNAATEWAIARMRVIA